MSVNKKPKLFYQVDENNIPMWDFCASALIGARENDIKAYPFRSSFEVDYDPYHIVVGSVEETIEYLNKDILPIDRKWASTFEKRQIIEGYLKDIQGYPIFIKPANEIKGFTGAVVLNKEDAENYTNNYKKQILIQEVKNIKSEYRVYVSTRGIIGVKHYLGCYYTTLDRTTVLRCWRKAKENLKELVIP